MHVERTSTAVSGEAGFTLVEVIATVVITIILSTVLVPQFFGMANRARLNGATRELVSDIMSARMSAVAKNKPYRLVVSSDKYTLYRDENRDGTYASDEAVEVHHIGKAYSGVYLKAKDDIDFSPRGTVTGGRVLVGNKTGSKTLTINIAGRVKIKS